MIGRRSLLRSATREQSFPPSATSAADSHVFDFILVTCSSGSKFAKHGATDNGRTLPMHAPRNSSMPCLPRLSSLAAMISLSIGLLAVVGGGCDGGPKRLTQSVIVPSGAFVLGFPPLPDGGVPLTGQSATFFNANEPHVAFSPPSLASGTQPLLTVGFNLPGLGGIGWFSGTPSQTANWQYCAATGQIAGLACGAPAIPLAPGQAGWVADPQVVADGAGNVVLVAVGETAPGKADLVVASLSTNGGRSFGSATVVNAGRCNDRDVDQPSAALDATA